MSCESTLSPNTLASGQNMSHKPTANFPQGFNSDGTINSNSTMQYFQQQQQQPSMFNNNTKVNDLQSFYKLQTNGEFNQLYQNHLQQQPNLSSNDCNASILQKLNEIMLNNAKTSSQVFMNSTGAENFGDSAFNHENYLNKLLLQKQSLKQSQHIAAPPGFNNNVASFNSPISTSSTSSSSSSTSSSVNNSTSTTPALNANGSNTAKTGQNSHSCNLSINFCLY